ncbi:exonuclease/endonuclease/phosphatase family protein [Lachnospira multipara]|uniref:hypothetical protein n=1 Tax=Lachnospira multipara TaxID=28051 RepID=UPI000414564C|nr:hypothetical protein [Lachnospira multipara]
MASDYKIGSFNIQKLGRNSMLKKDIKNIAEIITGNKMDVVALQEISGKEPLKEIMKALDGAIISEVRSPSNNARDSYFYETRNWASCWAKPISQIGGKSAEEGYAFIWNKRRLELPVNKRGDVSYPDIYLNGGKVIRPPFYGRFLIKSCNTEIRLINTHIVFRKTPVEDDELEDNRSTASDYEERIKEYKVLANEIYQRIYVDSIGTRQVLTFILGDYNMCLEGSNSSDLKAIMPKDIQRLEYGKHVIKTIQNQKTTIRSRSKSNPNGVYIGEENLANNYDYFSYEEKLEDSIDIEGHRIDAEGTYHDKFQQVVDNDGNPVKNEFEAYRMLVSDHLHIMMTVAISKG